MVATLLLAACGNDETAAPPKTAAPATPDNESTNPEPSSSPAAPAEDPATAPKPIPVGDGRGGVRLKSVGEFSAPVYVTSRGGADEIFVVEQGGRIMRVAGGKTSVFLDISDRVTSGGERGLLSAAFSPRAPRGERLYVNYTDSAGDTRVVEFRASGSAALADTARELLRISQPFANHNGGLVIFGPDRLLYIGTGDGGSAGDPKRSALDLSSLLGKILRIDPRTAAGRPYRVPRSNPFSGPGGGGRGEIYSYGLRNPWRFSFDRKSGALAIGDVGQNALEEIDLVRRGDGNGANFGWSAFEGENRFNSDQEAKQTPPVLTYPTADGNCSVTGGYVVRDRRLRSLYGRYLYGDFCLGELRSFPARPARPAGDDRALGLRVEQLSSFGEDDAGRIYATSLSGPVFRLEPKK